LVCQFEITAPDSPQQIGKVERQFAALYGRVRAILNEAEFNWPLRHAMWVYALLHTTKLDNLLIRPDTHLSPVYMNYGHTPEWAEHLHPFGEIAIVNLLLKSKPSRIIKVFQLFIWDPHWTIKGVLMFFGTPKQNTDCSFSRIMEHSTNWINQKFLTNLQQFQMN
jgi:hypothetical protein